MNLIELVGHFRNLESAMRVIAAELPGVYEGQVDIYLKDQLDVRAEVRFFDAETIPGTLHMKVDGVQYVNLFPFSMTQEMVEAYADAAGKNFSDLDIAKKLLDYRNRDA